LVIAVLGWVWVDCFLSWNDEYPCLAFCLFSTFSNWSKRSTCVSRSTGRWLIFTTTSLASIWLKQSWASWTCWTRNAV
jgi:hypothetical protein